MLLAITVLSLAATPSSPLPDAPSDLAQALEWLGRPNAPERLEGQRWLARNLEPEDLAPLSRSLLEAQEEVRRRVIAALGSDDRHLDLAALLAADPDPRLAELGRAALGERIAAWSASLDDRPLPRRRVPVDWNEPVTRPLSLDPADGELADLVDRLARLGGGPAPLVLDPSLDGELRPPLAGPELDGRPVGGTWLHTLEGLVRAQRVTFEVLGHREDEERRAAEPSAEAWVRVAPRGDLGLGTTRELLVGWCTELARQGTSEAHRAACARALAATGWSGGLTWLEARWVGRGDPAARSGLLLAAARGRVAPSLAEAETVRALLADLDRAALSEAPPESLERVRLVRRAEGLGRALAAIGPTGRKGRGLAGVLLEGWDEASALGRWVRLVALEGHGRLDENARGVLAQLLAHPGSGALRLQALRVLARAGGDASVRLAEPQALVRFALERGLIDEMGSVLAAAAVPVPEQPALWWRRLELENEATLALLDWAVAVGGRDLARDSLESLLTRGGLMLDLARRVTVWTAGEPRELVQELLSEAGASSDEDLSRRAQRVSLWCGLGAEDLARRRLDDLLEDAPSESADLLDLGVLATHPNLGWRAREALVECFDRPGLDASLLRAACELAHEGLLRARLDDEARAFAQRLESAARRNDHPLAESLAGDWPSRRRRQPRRLELEDRRLAPDEL